MVYVFLIAIAGYISGGAIHYRNKIKYLKERGWTVVVLPIFDGEIYINGLEEYGGEFFPFLDDFPNEYSKHSQKKRIKQLSKKIPQAETIIIETGSDYTAYWGELLAREIGAKHFHHHLDEKNGRISKALLPFFEFKYRRGEFASITKKTTQALFKGYLHLSDDEAHALLAHSSNSVEDYESALTDKIVKCDYNIGYIGRLSKKFVPQIIDGVCQFAEYVAPRSLAFTIFGGDRDEVVKTMEEKLSRQPNIRYFVTGYLFPFPEKAIRKCDMCIGAAGSRNAAAALGIPTLAMDVCNYRPIGIISEYSIYFFTNDIDCKKSVFDFIKQVLIDKDYTLPVDYPRLTWEQICNNFDKHMKFIEQSSKEKEYYPIETLPLNTKQRLFKILRILLTNKGFEIIRNKKRAHGK